MPAPGDIFNPWRMFNGCFIPNAVLRCRDLSARAKLVFGRLCQYAGENGEAFPSYRVLAQEVGVERRRAISAVRELEDFGLIRTVSRWRNDGAPSSNVGIAFSRSRWRDGPLVFKRTPGVVSSRILPRGVDPDTMWCRQGHPKRFKQEIQLLKRQQQRSDRC
jgi:hypothetical protein